MARDCGWQASGLESSAAARARAREFYGVELLDSFDQQTYNVVTLWNVIEHLRDPLALLKLIHEHMAPDGFLFIETGNFENWRRLAEGKAWGLYLFDHQFYFSPSSLQELLRRGGFDRFSLLDCDRDWPSMHPRAIIRHPFRSIRAWRECLRATDRWPKHGDINVMVAVAHKAAF